MAGLIQDQLQQQPQQPQQPANQEPMADDGPDPDTDPGYQQAMMLAMKALYEGEAAKDVAKTLKGSQNLVDALANTAYDIVSIVDERTDGAIPDELLVLFATRVLEEVAEIADAAGLDPQPRDVAEALKQMILRYLGEQGVDTSQLQQAMDQVNPDDFNKLAQDEQETAQEDASEGAAGEALEV